MTDNLAQTQQALQYAREALRAGDKNVARRWADQAARLAPQLEDPWLILASVSAPRESLQHLERALQINPDSPRARKGMAWAQKRLSAAGVEKREQAKSPVRSGEKTKVRRRFLIPVLLVLAGCLVVLLAGWTAYTNPVIASMFSNPGAPTQAQHPKVWAQVPIAKPTYTANPMPEVVLTEATATLPPPPPPTETPAPTQTAKLSPTNVPTDLPTQTSMPDKSPEPATAPTETPAITVTPGQLVMEIVESTAVPTQNPDLATVPTKKPASSSASGGVRWIEVNLSEQMVYAWEGDTLVNSFLVSTGTWATPTVTGTFKIWNKTRIQDMSGPGYYLPDVPWVMYFYKDYGFHGTYWHNNFGTPMSHGCVNLTIPAAEWLYNFGYVGMTVKVHY
ncbi:MAG: hypothetical protein Kow002_17150 [Anaerolineales bacterium]